MSNEGFCGNVIRYGNGFCGNVIRPSEYPEYPEYPEYSEEKFKYDALYNTNQMFLLLNSIEKRLEQIEKKLGEFLDERNKNE